MMGVLLSFGAWLTGERFAKHNFQIASMDITHPCHQNVFLVSDHMFKDLKIPKNPNLERIL